MTELPFPAPGHRPIRVREVEIRESWLWAFAVIVTLLLTGVIVSLTFPGFLAGGDVVYWSNLRDWVRGLAALVLLFDIYTLYQHSQLQRVRRELAKRNELFELITENAADMIAVVDAEGNREYNSPAYQRVLGYSAEDLQLTSAIEQVHPDDRNRVLGAAEKARATGRGQRLEYRMRHKDGSWRVLESTASVVCDAGGKTRKMVIVNRDITERKRVEEMLAHSAFHDGLTDLPNRVLFLDRLQHAMVRARKRPGLSFAVLFIDIDGFKVFNESLGHSRGDKLLIELGRRLTACFREGDTISRSAGDDLAASVSPASEDSLARLGGDEFTVLLEDVSNASDAIRVAQRIQDKLAIPFMIEGHEVVITASIGIVLSSASVAAAEDLLRNAELAMYRAKGAGKARAVVFDPVMHSSALCRLQLETDLRKAVERGEFRVHYQPIVSLPSGKIIGFEALSRWQRAEGLVMPGDFIPVADETGLILNINQALLLDACQQLKSWQAKFASEPPLSMSVNITPRQFAHPDLAAGIDRILQQTEVAPNSLHLEIMETVAMRDAERAGRVLSELKELGVRLSIDDFGIGYSSLSRLRRFPIDALKIDRVFISSMIGDPDSREIVRLIVVLAHNLGLDVVAEGIETQEQIRELGALDCEMGQGYFFSPPVDCQVISELLRRSVFTSATQA